MPSLQLTPEGVITAFELPDYDTDPDLHLRSLRENIDCEWIDRVGLDKGIDMWVDDEGLLTDKPLNVLASRYVDMARGRTGAVIAGTVVFAGLDGENTVNLTQEQMVFVIQRLHSVSDVDG